MAKLKIGIKAPDFKSRDHKDEPQSLALHKGKWILLYFYPKDDTPGCTKEACGIRDYWNEFKKQGVVVFGVSADSIAAHQRFAGKYELPFRLLADEDRIVIKKYGAWIKKKMGNREFMDLPRHSRVKAGIKRMSVLVNPQGKIAKIYDKVNPLTHARDVLEDLKSLQK